MNFASAMTPSQESLIQPTAGIAADDEGEISPDDLRIEAGQLGGSVDYTAGGSWIALVTAFEAPRYVAVREGEIRHLQVQTTLRDGPHRLRINGLEGDRDMQDRRCIEQQVAGLERDHTAFLRRLQASIKAGEAGPARRRSHSQSLEAPLDPKAGRLVEGAGHRAVDVLHASLRIERHQLAPNLFIKGKAIGDVGKEPEVDGVHADLQAPRLLRSRRYALQEKVERLRLSGTRDGEDELARGDLESVRETLPAQPAIDTLERELGQTVPQARAHARKPNVPGRLLHGSVRHVQPRTNGSRPVRGQYRERQPLTPARKVGIGQLGVQFAVPARELREAIAAKIAAHVQRRGKFGGRHRAQTETMAMSAAVQAQRRHWSASAPARQASRPAREA